MTGGRSSARKKAKHYIREVIDGIPARDTGSLRLLYPIYSVSFFYLLIWYHSTMPIYTPAREIGGMIKDYIAKEHPRFSIPPPLSPASGGILGLWLKTRCLRFLLGGTENPDRACPALAGGSMYVARCVSAGYM